MFGKKLKHYRIMKNYSQSDMAKKLFVTRQCISNWENDITQPDLQMLEQISNILDVSIDILVKDDNTSIKQQRIYNANIKLLTVNLFIGFFCIVAFIVLWRFIPSKIPAHWTNGVLDRYGSRNEIFFNLITVVVFLSLDVGTFFVTKRIDDKRGILCIHVIVLLFQVVNLIVITVIYAKYIYEVISYITAISASLLMCISVAMHPKLNKPNSFFGVRTSYTLKSPLIWNKTNLLACYLCTGMALFVLLLNMIFILQFSYLYLLIYILPVAISIIYSKILSAKEFK